MESARPFDWETHNCCHFAGRWVEVVEGRNPLASLPLPSMRAMVQTVREFGGLAEAVTHQLARAPIAPANAQLGDVVLMPTKAWGGAAGRFSVGICVGLSAVLGVAVAVFITDDGPTIYWPVRDALYAWRIEPPQTSAPA